MEELVRQLIDTLELFRRLSNEGDERRDVVWERGEEVQERLRKKLSGEAVEPRQREPFAERMAKRLERVKLVKEAGAQVQQSWLLIFRLLRDLSRVPEAREAADRVWDMVEEVGLQGVGEGAQDEEMPPPPDAGDFPPEDRESRVLRLLEYQKALREFSLARKAAVEAQRARRNELLSQAVKELEALLD